MTSRNGTLWSREPFHQNAGRQRSHNIVTQARGPTSAVRSICGQSPHFAFKTLITPGLVREIAYFTNLEGARNDVTWKSTSVDELYKFFGLLFLSGAYKDSRIRVSELWSADGRPKYGKTFSRNRFTQLLRFLRFDDKERRNKNDKFSPIRKIFDEIVAKFKSAYSASESLTVDEQLVTFRGRCPFKMFIPSKPGKYGLKLWILADSKTYYCLNLQAYIGKQGVVPEKRQGQRVVLQLTSMLSGTGVGTFSWKTFFRRRFYFFKEKSKKSRISKGRY